MYEIQCFEPETSAKKLNKMRFRGLSILMTEIRRELENNIKNNESAHYQISDKRRSIRIDIQFTPSQRKAKNDN